MEPKERVATCIPPGEGKGSLGGGRAVDAQMVGEDSNGAFTLLEEITPPQGEPPPHMHSREDEAFHVLEGELEFMVEDGTIRATAGSFTVLGPPAYLQERGNDAQQDARTRHAGGT